MGCGSCSRRMGFRRGGGPDCPKQSSVAQRADFSERLPDAKEATPGPHRMNNHCRHRVSPSASPHGCANMVNFLLTTRIALRLAALRSTSRSLRAPLESCALEFDNFRIIVFRPTRDHTDRTFRQVRRCRRHCNVFQLGFLIIDCAARRGANPGGSARAGTDGD